MIYHKSIFFFAILTFFGCQCFSQKINVHAFIENKKAALNSDTIYYDFDKTLSWSDFKGKPDENNIAGAVTSSGFAFDSQMNSDGSTINLNIGIYTFFTKSDSWKKPQINSNYHLLHEQHHFDITKLSTEKLLYAVNKAKFTKDNYTSLLTSLFDKAYEENNAMQQQYDNETQHSLNVEKQNEWNNKIAEEVKKLRESVAVKE